jgi:hypothetical protein
LTLLRRYVTGYIDIPTAVNRKAKKII